MPPIDPNRDVREVMEEWFQPTNEERLNVEGGAAALEIGGLLYKLRTEAGLTEEELAEKIGVSQSAITSVEDAEQRDAALGLLRRVAFALGKEVDLVLRDKAPREEPQAARELELA
jgi:DNA-binding XRE family transcriptional regulator